MEYTDSDYKIVDLIPETGENSDIRNLAELIFSVPPGQLDNIENKIDVDQSMDVLDLYCLILDIILFGVDILTNGSFQIFDIDDTSCDMIKLVSKYVKSMGFNMILQKDAECDASQATYLIKKADDILDPGCPKRNILGYQIISNEHIYCPSNFPEISSQFMTNDGISYNIRFDI